MTIEDLKVDVADAKRAVEDAAKEVDDAVKWHTKMLRAYVEAREALSNAEDGV